METTTQALETGKVHRELYARFPKAKAYVLQLVVPSYCRPKLLPPPSRVVRVNYMRAAVSLLVIGADAMGWSRSGEEDSRGDAGYAAGDNAPQETRSALSLRQLAMQHKADDEESACARLLGLYHNYTPGDVCPPDRHIVEALFHNPACTKPNVRRCRSRRAPASYVRMKRNESLTAQMLDANIDWGQFEHLDSYHAAVEAATTGRVNKGVLEPRHGLPWAAPEFVLERTVQVKERYTRKLGNYIHKLRRGEVRTAIDIGGGSGRFCSAMRDVYNVTCVVVTRDNKLGAGHYFDLPLSEMAVEDNLVLSHTSVVHTCARSFCPQATAQRSARRCDR